MTFSFSVRSLSIVLLNNEKKTIKIYHIDQ